MTAPPRRRHLQGLRRQIEKLPPYPSLLIVAVPLAVVEPLKLVIVFFAGEGHWIGGAIGMICAYAVSLFLTHWLFGLVKPKLLTIPWFARSWRWLVSVSCGILSSGQNPPTMRKGARRPDVPN
jgi:hypothetical protein